MSFAEIWNPRMRKYIAALGVIILLSSIYRASPKIKAFVNSYFERKRETKEIYSKIAFDESMIRIFHKPTLFSRRYGHFTANVCGVLSKQAKYAKYRINNDEWQDLLHSYPRFPAPLFTIELSPEDIRPGRNELTIEIFGWGLTSEVQSMEFEYDPSPIDLPITVAWLNENLEADEGFWEAIRVNGEGRVRPKPGFEGYDRILIVTGAFPGGRRIKTDLIFRYETGRGKPYGFGVLPLWGGRPDDEGITPNRGWNFGLVWFYSRYNAIGMEFSYKHGDASPKGVSTYFSEANLRKGIKYLLLIEAWPESDPEGNHLRYRKRMKWWPSGEKEPCGWMKLSDKEGCPLPKGEYGVALIAHRSQVDFGPVVLEPLQAATILD